MPRKSPKSGSEAPAEADRAPNAKRVLFAQEYLVDRNATRAAKRAGYSPKTAYAQGQRLLKDAEVQKLINAGTAERLARVKLSGDRIIEELEIIATSDIGDVMRVDKYGRVIVNDLDELPPAVRRCIESIKQTTTEIPDGDGGVVEKVQLAVKLHPKVKAIELLMEHHGLKAPVKGETQVQVSWADLVRGTNGGK